MSVTAMPASARTFAVPPVDNSPMRSATRPRARSTMPDLSETDSNACATVSGPVLDKLVLGELRAQRIPVQAQHLGRMRLVAVRSVEHRRQQGALDMRNNHVVNAMR